MSLADASSSVARTQEGDSAIGTAPSEDDARGGEAPPEHDGISGEGHYVPGVITPAS
jgi:hypothetical protein